MRNYKSLVLIVATIMLFTFAVAPQADAFVVAGTLVIIFAATMATAIVATETVKRSKSESTPDHQSSESMTQNNLQAVNEP